MSRNRYLEGERLRSYGDATHFLQSLVRVPPRTRVERESLGLSPIETLLDRIGNPHHRFPSIHITGSQGKGSTALYTEGLLAAAGLRTGTFTSPHLETWNERIRVGGTLVDVATFVAVLERIRPHVEALHHAGENAAPAFFDALTAAAFSVFADASVDIAVVEVGIGARLDPTRVCRAIATCVTGVDLEHTDRLGSTIADIAREKAAIARTDVPLVVGSVPPAAWGVLERTARLAGAPLLRLGTDVVIGGGDAPHACGEVRDDHDRDGPSRHQSERRTPAGDRRDPAARGSFTGTSRAEIEVRPAGRTIPIALRQPGRHMVENAALALALADACGSLHRLDDRTAADALESTILPGRVEVLRERPLVIADGAHTPAAVAALLAIPAVRDASRLVAAVSATRGKDVVRMLSSLLRRADTVIATTAEPSRSLPSAELAERLEATGSPASIIDIDSPVDAILAAMRVAGSGGTVCVTGSMYVAGAARRMFRGA